MSEVNRGQPIEEPSVAKLHGWAVGSASTHGYIRKKPAIVNMAAERATVRADSTPVRITGSATTRLAGAAGGFSPGADRGVRVDSSHVLRTEQPGVDSASLKQLAELAALGSAQARRSTDIAAGALHQQ